MDIKSRILELLGTYKFLTVSQMEQLGIEVSKRTLYKVLRSMKEPNRVLIGTRTFRYNPKYGRVEDIHYLRTKGKNHLIRHHKWNEEEVNMPIGNTLFYNDYQDRKTTINIQIAVRLAAHKHQHLIEFYTNYYEGKKNPVLNRRTTATRIETNTGFIRADSIFHLKGPKRETIYCLELHNGYRVTKICEQALAYADILASGSIDKIYNKGLPSKILIVFEHYSTLKTTFERLRALPKFNNLRKYFLLSTTENVINNPTSHWVSLEGKKACLYK